MILANRGAVWSVAPDGSVWEPSWGFAAIGSGSPYAYGAAFVAHMDKLDWSAEDIVKAALAAAVEFDAGCGGELRVFRVE